MRHELIPLSLAGNPGLRILKRRTVPHLKLKHCFGIGGVCINHPDRLPDAYRIALLDIHFAQVGINSQVITMANDDNVMHAGYGHDAGYHTAKNRPGLCSLAREDVNSIVLDFNILIERVRMFSKGG